MVNAIHSELIKSIVSGAVYPALVAVSWWFWRIGRRVVAVHKAIIPMQGNTIIEKLESIDSRIATIQNGLRFVLGSSETYECDASGQCIWVSQALADMFGLAPEDMLGSGWTQAIDGAEEREAAWDAWNNSITKSIPYRYTYTVRNRRTGERFKVDTHTVATRVNGKPIHYLGVCNRRETVRHRVDDADRRVLDTHGNQ